MSTNKKRGMSYAQMIGWFLFMAGSDHFVTHRAPERPAFTFSMLAIASALLWASEWLWHLVTKRYTIRIVRREATP